MERNYSSIGDAGEDRGGTPEAKEGKEMICWSARSQLSAHLDGRLPIRLARLIEAHLEQCVPCRTEFAHLRELKARLVGAARPTAPTGFWEATRTGLRENGRRQGAEGRMGIRSSRCHTRPGAGWIDWTWQRAPAMAAGMAILLLAASIPAQYLGRGPARSQISLEEMVARHAGYCSRQPLLAHSRAHYLLAEAGTAGVE
jgi:anti-sigma factor RsiW